MIYSWNVISYSEETVHTALITAMYSWTFMKMFLDILSRQSIKVTLILSTDEFFKIILIYSEEIKHNSDISTTYRWGILKFFLSYYEETVHTVHITSM